MYHVVVQGYIYMSILLFPYPAGKLSIYGEQSNPQEN